MPVHRRDVCDRPVRTSLATAVNAVPVRGILLMTLVLVMVPHVISSSAEIAGCVAVLRRRRRAAVVVILAREAVQSTVRLLSSTGSSRRTVSALHVRAGADERGAS
jgi:hypothetical protein